jgi:hypothetical protein
MRTWDDEPVDRQIDGQEVLNTTMNTRVLPRDQSQPTDRRRGRNADDPTLFADLVLTNGFTENSRPVQELFKTLDQHRRDMFAEEIRVENLRQETRAAEEALKRKKQDFGRACQEIVRTARFFVKFGSF